MSTPALTDPAYLQSLLDRAALRPQRTAGQNFLVCVEPVELAGDTLADGPPRVTELGAGMGTLTVALLERGLTVRAIERESALAQVLTEHVPAAHTDHLTLVVGDIRHEPWEWPEAWQLAGNIPYNLSGLILRRLTQLPVPPAQAVLMVQHEVAERLLATAPHLTLLGLAVQLWGQVVTLARVPASCFWPAPRVNSQLVLLTPHVAGAAQQVEREQILAFARPLFQGRRKQLGGMLRRQYHLSTEQAVAALAAVDARPEQRPQELSPTQWKALYGEIGKLQ